MLKFIPIQNILEICCCCLFTLKWKYNRRFIGSKKFYSCCLLAKTATALPGFPPRLASSRDRHKQLCITVVLQWNWIYLLFVIAKNWSCRSPLNPFPTVASSPSLSPKDCCPIHSSSTVTRLSSQVPHCQCFLPLYPFYAHHLSAAFFFSPSVDFRA